jgi:SPP1 family predicted phage head-tail adaptor
VTRLPAGSLNRRITIQRPAADDSFTGAGSGTWPIVAEVWANVQDVLPSRSERLADGINIATHPARVRIRYRTDITSNMRFVLGERIMQIVSGPAILGNKEGLEFMVEEYRPAGNGA